MEQFTDNLLEYTGPFAPLFGIVSSIVGVTFALIKLWMFKGSKWESGSSNLPGTLRKISGLACTVGLVLLWLDNSPTKSGFYQVFLFIIIAFTLIIYFTYTYLLGILTYTKPIGLKNKEKIIGARRLKPIAIQKIKKFKLESIQELFAGSGYDPDKIWHREDRHKNITFLAALNSALIIFGTISLIEAGLLVQVKLTDKPVSSIFSVKDVPGLIPEAKEEFQLNDSSVIDTSKFEIDS